MKSRQLGKLLPWKEQVDESLFVKTKKRPFDKVLKKGAHFHNSDYA